MGKKIHLALAAVHEKIARLKEELEKEETKRNKTKKKRIYSQLGHLKKAALDPEHLLVDPELKTKRKVAERHKKSKNKKETQNGHRKEIRTELRCLKCGSKEHLLGSCVNTNVIKNES